MELILSNEIEILEADCIELKLIKDYLTIKNPKFDENIKRGFSNFRTPKFIYFYKEVNGNLFVPFGTLEYLRQHFTITRFYEKRHFPKSIQIESSINLYDYQEQVLKEVGDKSGIIVMPAGSGKTQTALQLIANKGVRALWLTHTKDLLEQSYQRAKMNLDCKVSKITSGKISICEGITFATVQTLVKQDLDFYKDKFDIILTDECHRLVGSPAQAGMFYKVINHLDARQKIGLTATPYRALKGTEKAMFFLIGSILAEVDKENVKTTKAEVKQLYTDWNFSDECLKSDGTVDFAKMLSEMGEDEDRNRLIANEILKLDGSILVLSDRLKQLDLIKDLTGGAMIDGSMCTPKRKKQREAAIEKMRTGEERILYASYALAKEGLDIPRLKYVFFATPKKDKATIIQSVGRIERVFEGKDSPIVFDVVDVNERMLVRMSKEREKIYKNNGNELI